LYFPDLKIVEKPADMHKPKRGTLDISKARKLLDFQPDYNLEKGVEEYVEYMKKSFNA